MIGRTNAGGGGTGGTLTVNAPAGVTVIATNSTTNRTYTRTANSDGIAVFKGLATGTYLVHITDGTTTSDNFTATVVADYELTVKFFAAYINVTYPSGSTCTCTDGATTFTATSTSGSYQFVVPNTGAWTVSCTDGSQSTSSSVSITADEQSKSVTLSYFAATISITYPATSTCVVKNSSGATIASNSNTGSSTKTWTVTVQSTGTYTVTATSTSGSGETKSNSVSIATNGQSSRVTLKYDLYIFKSGTGAIVPLVYDKGGNANLRVTNTEIFLEFTESYSGGTSVRTNNMVDLTDYTTMYVDANCRGITSDKYGGGMGISKTAWTINNSWTILTAYKKYVANNTTTRYAIDITNYSGQYYCGAIGEVKASIYNIYLS